VLTSDNSPIISKDDIKTQATKSDNPEVAELQTKLAGYERVMREMKK
jgi:hypothetical protein